jgi:transcriptional regulator with XRE-family HTH domain
VSNADHLLDWGVRVRDKRLELGWTQAQLAEQSSVSQQLVSAIERGLQGGRDDTRRALARALGVRPNELFPYPEDLIEPAVPA